MSSHSGANSLESYFQPRMVAFALGAWAIAAYLRGRNAAALALVGVGMFAWFAQDQIAQTRRDRIGDWWVYLFAVAGLAYAGQIFLRGTL